MNHSQHVISIYPILWNLLIFSACIAAIVKYVRHTRHKPNLVAAWDIQWLDFFIFLWIVAMAFMTAPLLAKLLITQEEGASPNQWATLITALSTHILIILIFIFAKPIIKVPFFGQINTVSLSNFRALKLSTITYIYALPVFIVIQMAWIITLYALKDTGAPVDTSQQLLVTTVKETESIAVTILLGISGVIITPISEELIFRGTIYRFLKNTISPKLALISSSFIFSLIHFNLLSFLPLFFLGIFLGLSYEKSGNIKVPIFYHAIFNLVSVVSITINKFN